MKIAWDYLTGLQKAQIMYCRPDVKKWEDFMEEQTDHHEEYLLAEVSPIPQCPHIRRKSGGDETYDFCDLTEKMSGRIHPCLLVSGDTCDTWQEIQEEWLREEQG